MKLRNSRPRILQGKPRNLSESDWRGITYQNWSFYLKVCFKISNECVQSGYLNGKKKQRNISSGYSLIMRQLKWRLYMKTDTRLFSVLSLLSIKLQKTFIKVLKTSRFAIVRKLLLLSKRCTPKNRIWGWSGARVWGIVSLCVSGVGE